MYFLVKAMKERYQKRPIDNIASVENLVQRGVAQNIAEILVSRGIDEKNYADFLNDRIVFHSPFEMANMKEAVETINYVVEIGGKILIYGDYDADGLTASSILSLYFNDIGIENDVVIPTRDEGYGLHAENVFRAFENDYYDLVITVDCGISNADDVAKIQSELGVDVIVTDHHELPDSLPECICIDPKMEGYPFPYLAGAGVAWKLVEALAGRETALNYCDLACVGTIGDIMPMQDENRAIVKMGLENFRHRSLKKLAESCNCSTPVTCNDVSMKIVPRINSAGRIGSPASALQVLLGRDKVDTAKINELLQLNEKRRQMVDQIALQADDLCDWQIIHRERMVFLYSDRWQHGLLGIVAARCKEKYKVPAIVMALDGDKYVGSARSIDAINLFEVFCKCKDLLIKFGGHKASVGFSVSCERLVELRTRLSALFNALDSTIFEKRLCYDVEWGELDMLQAEELTQKLQPLLPQDKIVFRVSGVVDFASSFGKDEVHLSATMANGLALKGFFKFGAYVPFLRKGANVDLLCTLENDHYTNTVYGIIEDMTLCNSVCFDDFYKLNLLRNFSARDVEFTQTDIDEILRKHSCAVVFDDCETYLSYCEKYDLEDYALDIFFDNSIADKTVVVSPLESYNWDKYDNIVYFAHKGIARTLPERTLYVSAEEARKELYSLQLNREICSLVYTALRRKKDFDRIKSVYDVFLTGKMSYIQFVVAMRVLEELKLIKVTDKYTVEFDSSVKQDLNNSAIYRCFSR